MTMKLTQVKRNLNRDAAELSARLVPESRDISTDLPSDWYTIRAHTAAGGVFAEQLSSRHVGRVRSAIKHYDYKYSGDRLPKLGPAKQNLVMVDAARADHLKALSDMAQRRVMHESKQMVAA